MLISHLVLHKQWIQRPRGRPRNCEILDCSVLSEFMCCFRPPSISKSLIVPHVTITAYPLPFPCHMRFGAFERLHSNSQQHQAPDVPLLPDVITSASSLPNLLKAYCEWRGTQASDLSKQALTLLVLAKYTCQMSAANYQLSNKQKLMLLMLIDGNNWRAHRHQIFQYSAGSWNMRSAISVDAWDMLTALEGLFIDSATMLDMAED